MSNPGERDDALEVEEVETDEIEQEGADGSGADEDGDDGLEEESGDGSEHLAAGDDARQGAGERDAQGQVAQKPRSSATIAVQEAKRAAKAAKEEAEAARRELNELRQQAMGRQTEQQRQEEAERLRLMTAEEKVDYYRDKDRKDFEGRIGTLQFQMQDHADRMAFDSLSARNDDVGRAYASIRDEVEQRLSEMRRGGGTAPREAIAKYLLGERAVQRLARTKGKQERKGQQNIQRQTARPSGGRSDVPQQGQRGGSEAEKRRSRLENQEI